MSAGEIASRPYLDWLSISLAPAIVLVMFPILGVYLASSLSPGSIHLFPSVALEPELYDNFSVYMLVCLVNYGNQSRIQILERVWGSDFRNISTLSRYEVGCDKPLNVPGSTVLSPRIDYPEWMGLRM